MTVATNNNTATPATEAEATSRTPRSAPADVVERALAAAIRDATRISDLLDALRTAQLWLPLPDDGTPATDGAAVTLPTVTYLGSEFVPAYTSAEVLTRLAGHAESAATIPHVVVRAADLARLMPAGIGIALNAGASESVPVYPPGVEYLAADDASAEGNRITVGPVPAQPEDLLASIRASLGQVPQVRQAAAAWLSVQFAGEGLVIAVTLDDPADDSAREAVVAALEDAARASQHDPGYPIDVTFPGEGDPDPVDRWVATSGQPFYQRG